MSHIGRVNHPISGVKLSQEALPFQAAKAVANSQPCEFSDATGLGGGTSRWKQNGAVLLAVGSPLGQVPEISRPTCQRFWCPNSDGTGH